ncbi:MAG TPA: sodium/solute symporter [Vicinamibacterales bacterium]|nr:sodium/solute symporter [Vicinamibacterales bacterium]
MQSSFHLIDWVIIGAYLLAMALVGVYFSRRQTSLNRYLRADQSMGWLPVGVSLMAALNSGMDYLMQPSATIRYGIVLVAGITSWLALYPWVARVAFPFYHRLNFYTVYEYLEARFDVRVRTLAAMIFILWRLGWMATAMYVPGLAINAAAGGQIDVNTVTIVVGVLVTLYTMLGGIQAVIWNDVVQFCIMFGGLAATVAIAWMTVPGGWTEIWSVNAAAGKIDWWPPLVDPGTTGFVAQVESFFRQPMTLVTLLVALIVGRMAQYTSDQVMVQRLQTTRSLRDARSAFVVNAAGDALWMTGLAFVGFALFAYFQRVPLPPEFSTDKLLPYFMSLVFPAGAVGLVIAAIMAASLSSIDSAINSCTSVAVVDLYDRVWRGVDRLGQSMNVADDRSQVQVSRLFTAVFGALGTTLACNVGRIGSLLEINAKVVNAFTGPLFGIFLLAMFNRRAGSVAVLTAGVAGAITAYYVAYHSGIGFMWPSTFGLAATLASGCVMAMAKPMRDSDPRGALTWRAVMNRTT